jgi:hypothetical protein
LAIVFVEKLRMHARPQDKEILLAHKLQKWARIARYEYVEPNYPRAKARKNYWRLYHRYPEIAARIGLHEWSVYG